MREKKPHLRFTRASEGAVEFIQRPGGGGSDDNENKVVKNYLPIAQSLRRDLVKFNSDIANRHQARTIRFEEQFDTVLIEFQGVFDLPKFESKYYDAFGLKLMDLHSFNTIAIFAVEDQTKFDLFRDSVNKFYDNESRHREVRYDAKLRFIKKFKAFTSVDRLEGVNSLSESVYFSFKHSGLLDKVSSSQREQIEEFLQRKEGVSYSLDDMGLMISSGSYDLMTELTTNFDIITSTCSSVPKRIRPSELGQKITEVTYDIEVNDKDLPAIGVIDSGFSKRTPLKNVLLDVGEDYDLTDKGLYNDFIDHGTGVATFAAIGVKALPDYNGVFEADAHIVPIKIIHDDGDVIDIFEVLKLIRKAYHELGTSIFCLTVNYENHLKFNEQRSGYAYLLDSLVAELDILLFVSASNNLLDYIYPSTFTVEESNISSPADTMNSVVVGAIADNCDPDTVTLVAPSEEFPAIYSCTGHINFDGITSNNHLRTPDIVLPGGDYEDNRLWGPQSLNVVVDNERYSAEHRVGTSYSTPIAANMAAKILRKYPNLRMQSVKALMINHSEIPNYGNRLDGLNGFDIHQIVGYGIPNGNRILSSSNDDVTFILEKSIQIGELKTFELSIPQHLNSSLRQSQLLNISATLCFKFDPIPHNQLAYCPFHLSFAIGKNMPIEGYESVPDTDENGSQKEDAAGTLIFKDKAIGYNGNSSKDIKLSAGSKGWADDYYYRNKMCSNVQKVTFNIPRGDLIEANKNIFKIGVFAAFQKYLSKRDVILLERSDIEFSLVVSIKQNSHNTETLISLYDELMANNEMVALGDLDAEAYIGY